MESKHNELLNRTHKDKCCVRCGRKYPDTLLNIEGYIHHNCQVLCLDTKKCRQIVKKRGKNGTR